MGILSGDQNKDFILLNQNVINSIKNNRNGDEKVLIDGGN